MPVAREVWTRDVGRALSAARLLEFGCVWIDEQLPFLSEMSVYSLEDDMQIEHVMAKL